MDNRGVDKSGAPFWKERHKGMKVKKSQALLYIFDTLMKKGYITKEDALSDLEVSELNFWRYIQEIKAYLYNFDTRHELVYDRKSKRYKLVEIVLEL